MVDDSIHKRAVEFAVKHNQGGGGAYFLFKDDIPKGEINTVVELGSRDGLDAIWLHKHFAAEVVCWECHPDLIELVKHHIQFFPEIELVDKAVWSEKTNLEFHIVVNGNVGASSVFKGKNEEGRPQLEQQSVSVETETLESWWQTNREGKTIDLLCLDLQGAEIEALKGASTLLPEIKYIITEGCRNPEYEDAPPLDDIRSLLAEYGFQEVSNNEGSLYADEHQADYLFSRVVA
tara:strand:+ start:2171 stop:2872 length:702 start_codon:yes stop_codon:yes gene_type:complete